MARSRGAYIAFLDADDVYYPNRLAGAVAMMEREPDVDAVFGRFDYIMEEVAGRKGIKKGNQYDDTKLSLDPLMLYLSGQSGAHGSSADATYAGVMCRPSHAQTATRS